MIIPKSFKLLGKTIDVEFDKKLDNDNAVVGRCNFRTDKIILQPYSEEIAFSNNEREQIFLHELVHWIIFTMGRNNDLGADEKFIDLFAGMLHQALNTMEYQ